MRKSISLILALMGLFDSLYLLWIYTSPCGRWSAWERGCDAVRLSVYSHFWGVPMPVFGVAGYALMALLIMAESLVPAPWPSKSATRWRGQRGLDFSFRCIWNIARIRDSRFLRLVHYLGPGDDPTLHLAIYNLVSPGPEADPPAQLAQLRRYFVVGVGALRSAFPPSTSFPRMGKPSPASHRRDRGGKTGAS